MRRTCGTERNICPYGKKRKDGAKKFRDILQVPRLCGNIEIVPYFEETLIVFSFLVLMFNLVEMMFIRSFFNLLFNL